MMIIILLLLFFGGVVVVVCCVVIYATFRLQRPKPHIRLQASVSCLAPSI